MSGLESRTNAYNRLVSMFSRSWLVLPTLLAAIEPMESAMLIDNQLPL